MRTKQIKVSFSFFYNDKGRNNYYNNVFSRTRRHILAISAYSTGLIPKFTILDCPFSAAGVLNPRKTLDPIPSHFRHFYAWRGETLKWKHRVVAYGYRYSEITVSLYALWFPRSFSDALLAHLPYNPIVRSTSRYSIWEFVNSLLWRIPRYNADKVIDSLLGWENFCSFFEFLTDKIFS